MLFFDASLMRWKLEIYSREDVYATVNSTDYPFGTLVWEVSGDVCQEENSTHSVELNLNACKPNEFNCADGSCVNVEQRCDGNVDCPDKTGSSMHSQEITCPFL